MADIDELLTRLKAQQSPSAARPSSQSKPASNEQQTTNSLLNLLNIRAQAPLTPQRATSSFTYTPNNTLPDVSRTLPVRLSSASAVPIATEPPATTKNFLLDLLTKPKTEQVGGQVNSKAADIPTKAAIDATQSASVLLTPKADQFKYVNPFDQLHASSPLKLPQDVAAVSEAQEDAFSQQPSAPDEDKSIESVAEKLDIVAAQVDAQVDKALLQAELQQKDDEQASSWETAEDNAAQDDTVSVYNFPMRPFVGLTVTRKHAPRAFRRAALDKATPVARLKKDFSHDDRSLAAATQRHIVYAVAQSDKKPASGIKLIRQDDGKNKHLWAAAHERICNVQIAGDDKDVVLATGINGTIFYADIAEDDFENARPDLEGLLIPAPASDEPAQPTDLPSVKTRVRLSNLKPESYFAASRGRTIYLFAPDLARRFSTEARVDTTQYLASHNFSVNVGKACKDFCFSEDDTVIATLDKLGRLKFWDIRPLTSAIEEGATSRLSVKEPLFQPSSIVSSKAEPKSSACSVMFLDKERVHLKKNASRYVLLGFQQNRVLQLWDLGLSKCVQELTLPEGDHAAQSEESKAVCPLHFHPKTSMIIIGHPGRNSVFLIHLSAPKYDLAPLSQAAFLTALAKKDTKTAPRPESTAIMSGMREYSLSNIGQLRSLEVLKSPFQDTQVEDRILFELYIMHSKGLLVLPISTSDLGWDSKGKLLHAIDAVATGVLTLHELKTEALPPSDTSKAASRVSSALSTPIKAASSKPEVPVTTQIPASASKLNTASEAVPARTQQPASQPSVKENVKTIPEATLSVKENVKTIPEATLSVQALSTEVPSSEPEAVNPASKHVNGLPKQPDLEVEGHFVQLYKKLENDRRIQDAAAAAKQDAVLRLVSSTLTENVESSLHSIVLTNMQQMLPDLQTVIAKTVTEQMQATLPSLIGEQLDKLLPTLVSQGMTNALKDTAITTSYASALNAAISSGLGETLTAKVQQALESNSKRHQEELSILAPASQVNDVLERVEASEARITALLQALQQEQHSLGLLLSAESTRDAAGENDESEPDETKVLAKLIKDGRIQDATVGWLQSARQVELFDELFIRVNPAELLPQVSSLVALSVGAAVTTSLETNIEKRLEWLAPVVSNIDVQDAELVDVAPKIMDVLTQRLQGAYMQVSEDESPNQAVLRKIAAVTKLVRNTRNSFS